MSQTPEQTIAELQKKIKDLELQLKKAKDSSGYGLKWEEKPEIFEERAQNALPLLKENKDLLIDNNSDLDNIIIEWDNYHALSALNYTHKWKIDMIYIDPPYNTWAKDWTYNNDYVDKEDTYRHSKRISMMNKRLKLAKSLLSDRWFIICAIDHYELFSLWLLMDDIFWEENRHWIITVVHKAEGRQFAKWLNPTNEYYLVYAKSPEWKINNIPLDDEVLETFSLEDDLWRYRLEDYIRRWWWAVSLRINKPSCWYPIYVSKDCSVVSLDKIDWYIEVYPITEKWEERTWNTSPETFLENLEKWDVIAKNEWWKYKIFRKYREQQSIKTHWVRPKYNATRYWTQLLYQIMCKDVFSFPKSLYAVQDAIKITTQKDSIILDFFAWSWTTGHAVLDLNKQDWWHRKFILCSNRENTIENPDKNICKNVTYERVKRVLQWYTSAKWEKIEWLKWWNLRYYITEFIEKKKSVDDLRQSFIYLCDELLCIKEDTFNEYKSELLSNKLKCYQKNNHYTVILYDIREIEKLQQLLSILNGKISVYIFSLSKDSCEEELQDFSDKITIENIPDDILETYKKIF